MNATTINTNNAAENTDTTETAAPTIIATSADSIRAAETAGVTVLRVVRHSGKTPSVRVWIQCHVDGEEVVACGCSTRIEYAISRAMRRAYDAAA